MKKTKTTETKVSEKPKSVNTELNKVVANIKQFHAQGFNTNRIAAMLMCSKALVKEVLGHE
tara:strand:+ start:409 stop:591 length:183 start_codon:yes stop_codon:yes gene_type:complete